MILDIIVSVDINNLILFCFTGFFALHNNIYPTITQFLEMLLEQLF